MTDAEEIEFERVLNALDVAKRRLRELTSFRISVYGNTDMNIVNSCIMTFRSWGQRTLDEIEEAEGEE